MKIKHNKSGMNPPEWESFSFSFPTPKNIKLRETGPSRTIKFLTLEFTLEAEAHKGETKVGLVTTWHITDSELNETEEDLGIILDIEKWGPITEQMQTVWNEISFVLPQLELEENVVAKIKKSFFNFKAQIK